MLQKHLFMSRQWLHFYPPTASLQRAESQNGKIRLLLPFDTTIYRLFTFLVLLILLLVCLRDTQADDLYQALIAKYAFTQPDNLMSCRLYFHGI